MNAFSTVKSVLAGLLIVASAHLAHAEDQRNMLNVSGECLKSISQDRAAVTLTADFLETSASAAAKKATSQYNSVVDKIKKLNLKDVELETTEYSVMEDFDYTQNGGRKSKGFRSRNGLRVETSEIERMGEVMKIGADLGVKSVSSLTMFVSRQKWKTEREGCLEEAFMNARSKAERLAKISGAKIKGVARIDESGSGYSGLPREMVSMEMSAPMGGAMKRDMAVQARSESLQVNVSVQFLIQ